MPSQEEYLDNLLNDIVASETAGENIEPATTESVTTEPEKVGMKSGEPETVEPETAEPETAEPVTSEPEQTSSPIDVEDTMDMSEDEIEKLLNQSQQESEAQAAEPAEAAETKKAFDGTPEDNADGENVDDLMGLLNNSDDADLKDIHDMLDKSDRNEAVNDDIVSLLQGIPDDDTVSGNGDEVDSDNERSTSDIEELLSGSAEGKMSQKEQKAELRRKKKEEKAAKKQALKEEKAAKKAARIAAKQGATEEADAVPEAESDAEVNAVSAGNADSQGETDSQGKTDADVDMDDIDELLGLANQGALASGVSDSDSAMPADDDTAQESQVTAGEHKAALVDAMTAENKPAKKKGFFAKILEALTEEDEEEEPQKENEDIQLSEENKNIIEELDKNKKKKKKKGKKNAEAAETPEGEEGEEAAEKPKKAKRKKKEKAPKTEEETEQPKGSRLSLKKVLPILLVCLTFGACVVVLANISGEYAVKKEGRKAFYDGDYQTCYQNLYGKELTESEQVMFSKSESILCIRLWLREYEMFAEEGKRAEALDSLIQSVNSYPDLHGFAQQWNAGTEVELMYQQLLDILSEQYNLTEEQALEIAAVKNDADYSIRVYAIANGEAFGSWDELQPDTADGAGSPTGDSANGDSVAQDSSAEVLQDALPGEEDFENAPFIDNISQDGQE